MNSIITYGASNERVVLHEDKIKMCMMHVKQDCGENKTALIRVNQSIDQAKGQ